MKNIESENWASFVNRVSSEFDRKFKESITTLGCKQIKEQFGWDLTPEQYENMVEGLRKVELEIE